MPRRTALAPESSAKDRDLFASAIRLLEPFDDRDVAAGYALLRPRDLARGEILLRAGARATSVFFVTRGMLREFFQLDDGTERTKAFVRPGELSGSLADLLSSGPSRAYIVAEARTRVLVGSHASFRALAEHSPAWERFGRRSLEQLLVRKAEREFELLGLDAKARYAIFAQRYPGLEVEIAGKHVASYLGITPVHLSRLRRTRRVDARATRSSRTPR